MGDVERGFLKTEIILLMRVSTHDCKVSNFSKKISEIYSVLRTFQKHSVFPVYHWSFSAGTLLLFFFNMLPTPTSHNEDVEEKISIKVMI